MILAKTRVLVYVSLALNIELGIEGKGERFQPLLSQRS